MGSELRHPASAGAPGVTPSGKNNSGNFPKYSPGVGRALDGFTHHEWSLNCPFRGVPCRDLRAQGTRDGPSLEDVVWN